MDTTEPNQDKEQVCVQPKLFDLDTTKKILYYLNESKYLVEEPVKETKVRTEKVMTAEDKVESLLEKAKKDEMLGKKFSLDDSEEDKPYYLLPETMRF